MELVSFLLFPVPGTVELLHGVGFFFTFPNSRDSRVLRKLLVTEMKKETLLYVTHNFAAVFVTASNWSMSRVT